MSGDEHVHIGTTLIVPINACGTNSQNMHYLAKSQNWRGLKYLPSNIVFMNTCSFIIHFNKISACSKVLVK